MSVWGHYPCLAIRFFRKHDWFNGDDTFLDFLKTIHSRFPKCCLFMDKALPHCRSRKVKGYLEQNKCILFPAYLPILNGVEILEEKLGERVNEFKRELDMITRNASRLQNLADSILQVSRIESGSFSLDIQKTWISTALFPR